MFERFTDRARKALALANQEAKNLNHDYLGPEHILIGILKEGNGVAVNVLRRLSFEPLVILFKITNKLQSNPAPVPYLSFKLPQLPSAKKAIQEAVNSSRDLNHSHVGTEHMLLGILSTQDNCAANTLRDLGLTKEAFIEGIIQLLGPGIQDKTKSSLADDPVMALAMRGHAGQKRSNGSDYISHPISVRKRLADWGIKDKDVLNAALCHDLLEDTSITEEEIRSVAGEAVLEAVKQLTNVDPPGEKRDFATKTKDMLEHAKHYGNIAKIVKVADRYDNLADAVREWEPYRVKRYAQAGLSLLDAMTPLPEEVTKFAVEARRFFSCIC